VKFKESEYKDMIGDSRSVKVNHYYENAKYEGEPIIVP
jgi:hypothetical protein